MNEKTVIKEAIKADMPDFEQVRAACIAQGSIVTTKETKGVRHIPVFSAALAVVVMIMSFPFLSVQPIGLNELTAPKTEQNQTINKKNGTVAADTNITSESTDADNTEDAAPSDTSTKSPAETSSSTSSEKPSNTIATMPEDTDDTDDTAATYALTDASPQAYTVNYIDSAEQSVVKDYLSNVGYLPVPGQISRYNVANMGDLKQYLDQRNYRLMKSYINQTDMTMLRVTDKQGLMYICYTYIDNEECFFIGSGMSSDDFIDRVFSR